jgi:hypothetical protein
MAITPLNSFVDVKKFIDKVLADNGDSVGGAAHGAFWNDLTYDKFVNGDVPNETDPANNDRPVRILVKGNSAQSNLIFALLGIGPTFGRNGSIGRMPRGGTAWTLDQIKSIAAWIDNGCPE